MRSTSVCGQYMTNQVDVRDGEIIRYNYTKQGELDALIPSMRNDRLMPKQSVVCPQLRDD